VATVTTPAHGIYVRGGGSQLVPLGNGKGTRQGFFPGHGNVAAQARVSMRLITSDFVHKHSWSSLISFRQARPRFPTPPLYAGSQMVTRPATRPCVSELLPTGMEESAEADLVRVLTELECAASAFSVADGRR